jgi:hypothetical protein
MPSRIASAPAIGRIASALDFTPIAIPAASPASSAAPGVSVRSARSAA